MKEAGGHSIPLLREPGKESGRPLYMQLYRRIREGVLEGAIPPGTRLPSARTLAREEGISRNTVEAAFRQLLAEGFVTRRVGSGTWISERIPNRPRRPSRSPAARPPSTRADGPAAEPAAVPAGISARGRRIVEAGAEAPTPPNLLFAPCVPGLDALPLDTWNRIAARSFRGAAGSLLVPPPPAGLPALREAVAAYLHLDRGVRCSADRVVIVNSTQQATDLVARLLLDPGDAVWLEDPGYVSGRRAIVGSGARVVPVRVDGEGIDVAGGEARAPRARLACVTPSHQYPLGVTLSLARRLALLDWAERAGGWILEDDYDSELRYDGRPLASVQSIDDSGRVLYVGTFNKILFPALRVAYLVLPPELVEPFARAKQHSDGFTSPLLQAALAEFIAEGHFAVHLRKVRSLYRERRDRFLAAAAEHLPEEARLGPAEAGMHAVLHLPAGVDDEVVSERARRRGLSVPALSTHAIESEASGLLVHYGNAAVDDIESGTRRLGEVLRE
jgi:GntR family transcriptional regulator/MocR family aminotransferase